MRDIIRHLPTRLLRPEIRRRALRAATAVAVGAVGGCGALDEPVAGVQHADALSGADGSVGMRGGDAGSAATPLDGGRTGADSGTATADLGKSGGVDAGIADAGIASADTSPATSADAVGGDIKGDTTVTTGVVCRSTGDFKDFQRCCDENGWNWNKGCMAWGPPAPPTLDEATLGALISGLYAIEVTS